MFSLVSPHGGDSNEYTQHTIFKIKQENYLNFSQICSHGIFSKGLKNMFENSQGKRAIEVLLYKFFAYS